MEHYSHNELAPGLLQLPAVWPKRNSDEDAPWNQALRGRKRLHARSDNMHPSQLPSLEQPLRQLREDASQLASATPQTPKSPRSRRRRKRFGLPLLVASPSGASAEVTACPDSGSDENIISLELVQDLGLKTEETNSDEPRQFTVANGNTVTAVGKVSTRCSFAAGTPSETTSLECVFHVFNTLAVPLIMGLGFLQQTETLSKHRNRLVEQPAPAMQALRVNSVGRPKRSLVCRLDTYVGCATVDTGSDLDLVNPAFVKARGYKIEPAFEQLEFADCSVGYTSGVVKTSFVVGSVNPLGFRPRGETIDLELFVLDSLNADILVGQDTVDTLDIFNLHNESLIPSMPRLGESDINIIRHIGRLEQGTANLWKKIKSTLGGNPSGSSDRAAGVEAQVDTDQRECARRERERARIAKLSGSEKQRAQDLEDMAIRTFESERQRRLSPLPSSTAPLSPQASNFPTSLVSKGGETSSSTAATVGNNEVDHTKTVETTNLQSGRGVYKCPFTWCSSPPFQTQDDLDSHLDIHSLVRSYYLPSGGVPK